jgi:hypothetical protein
MKSFRIPIFFVIAGLGALAPVGNAQLAAGVGAPSSDVSSSSSSAVHAPIDLGYTRPTSKMKLRSYLFDAVGPYPVLGAAVIGGISQADKTPPEWGEGFKAYGERVGSNFGIALVTTTTRYGLAAAFHEDTLYYRCECKGIFHRFKHAMISTVTARRGEDGHREISFPALVAPYAGTMTAVYAWYPGRYNTKDAFRMGNYNLLAFAGENLALEFIYGGPHTLFSHLHRPAFSGTDSGSAPSR